MKAELHFTSITEKLSASKPAKRFTIDAYNLPKPRLIFIYGSDLVRESVGFNMLYFWTGRYFFIFISLMLGAIILYKLRRSSGLQAVDFIAGFLEVFSMIFNGGNIRYRHQLEKLFFAIGLIASFFLVSMYLAHFSIYSILFRDSSKVDSFVELAKYNVTFGLNSHLAEHKTRITDMLRWVIRILSYYETFATNILSFVVPNWRSA